MAVRGEQGERCCGFRPDLAALREVKCAELEDAADGWGRVGNRADAARDRIEGQLLPGLHDTQKGEAVGAAVGRLRRLGANFQYISVTGRTPVSICRCGW